MYKYGKARARNSRVRVKQVPCRQDACIAMETKGMPEYAFKLIATECHTYLVTIKYTGYLNIVTVYVEIVVGN